MPLDQEPHDGDYAAYIDKLVNGRKGSPGAVGRPLSRSTRRHSDARQNEEHAAAPDEATPAETLTGYASPGETLHRGSRRTRGSPSPVVIRRDHNSHTEFEYVTPDDGSSKADSLGPQGSPRLSGIIQIALGLGTLALFARTAIHMTYSAEPFSLDYIIPLLLLGFIARMFLARGHARLRQAGSGRAATRPGKRRQRRAPLP